MKLKRDKLVSKVDLIALAEARHREAEALFAARFFAGAVYVGGYAVECCLKAAICRAIGQDHLTSLFKSHDLVGLLYHSGLEHDLDGDAGAMAAFKRIVGQWNDQNGDVPRRYESPSATSDSDARDFLNKVGEVKQWCLARI